MREDQILRRGFQGGISVYAAMGVTALTGLAISVILVRGLSQEEYGGFRLVGSLLTLSAFVTSLGLDQGLMRFGPELLARNAFRAFVSLVRVLCSIRGIVLFLLSIGMLFLKDPLARSVNLPPVVVDNMTAVVVLICLVNVNRLWGDSLLALRLDQIHISVNQILVAFCTVTAYAVIMAEGMGLTGVLWAWCAVQMISTFHFSFINWRWFLRKHGEYHDTKGDVRIDRSYTRRILRFALFSFLAMNINIFKDLSIDNLIIGHYLSAREVGIYGVACVLVMFPARLNPAALLRGVWGPLFVTKYVDGGSNESLVFGYSVLTKMTIFCVLPLFTYLALLGDKVIELVFSPLYMSALPCLIVLSFFFFVMSLNYAFNPIVTTLEKNELFTMNGVFSLLNLAMSIILVPRFGILGAAVATGSAGMFQFFFYVIMSRWYLRIRLPFPVRAMAKGLINVVPAATLSFLLRPYIHSVFVLMLSFLVFVTVYLGCCFWNKLFNSLEREVFNSAIGRELWCF